mmetsp:Transcript_15693/g.40009  ORF Transcript_15693/g.40009 Transcript_15693/m.40009 type:complete len:244 (+) Transcript_15693:342-1073(+)
MREERGRSAGEMVASAARTTLSITTMPLKAWVGMWMIVLRCVLGWCSAPFALCKRAIGPFGLGWRSNARAGVETASDESKSLQYETKQAYESQLQQNRKVTEELREMRTEMRTVLDAVQHSQSARRRRKPKEEVHNEPPMESVDEGPYDISDESDYRLLRFITHICVAFAMLSVWHILKAGPTEQSVERKLLLCLSLPVVWLYIKSVAMGRKRTMTALRGCFVVANLSCIICGFVLCSFFHPH